MQCHQCGFENRPQARFCMQCGQTLEIARAVQPTSPSVGIICPSCGATAKPGARFCPRCGKVLPTVPMQSRTQPGARAELPDQPPLSDVADARERRFPSWLWWVGGISLFVFIVVIVVISAFVLPESMGSEEEPTATLVAATEQPPVEIPVMSTVGVEQSTAASVAELPTATPLADTPTAPYSLAPLPQAEIDVAPLAPELRLGERLTITAIVTNTGQVSFGHLRYQLLGPWEPWLGTEGLPVVSSSEEVGPGTSVTTTYVLEAMQVGTAILHVAITMETPGELSLPGGAISEKISVFVVD